MSDARGYDVNGDVTGYDWAILRLYQPLGSALGYYGFNGYSSSWNNQPWWSIVGYPGAIANAQRPSFQGGITVGLAGLVERCLQVVLPTGRRTQNRIIA